jgi:RNA polymerase sigma factor (TIGR02999 family)
MNKDNQITEMLIAWSAGDESSLERLLPIVEAELRRIAHNYMRGENPNHTLQTTALVNEAYMKLVEQRAVNWQNRSHFFALSANIMRRILINHARDRLTQKRGGNTSRIRLENENILSIQKSAELIALDEALTRLSKFDKTKSRIVEMRYFGGLTLEETAEVLGIARSTISLHWRLARVWLQKEIAGESDEG